MGDYKSSFLEFKIIVFSSLEFGIFVLPLVHSVFPIWWPWWKPVACNQGYWIPSYLLTLDFVLNSRHRVFLSQPTSSMQSIFLFWLHTINYFLPGPWSCWPPLHFGVLSCCIFHFVEDQGIVLLFLQPVPEQILVHQLHLNQQSLPLGQQNLCLESVLLAMYSDHLMQHQVAGDLPGLFAQVLAACFFIVSFPGLFQAWGLEVQVLFFPFLTSDVT